VPKKKARKASGSDQEKHKSGSDSEILLKQPLECADRYAYVFQIPSQPQVGQWQ